jgi:hypothetical protein
MTVCKKPQARYQGHTFGDDDVVNLGEAVWGDDGYNPRRVRPWLLYTLRGTLAVVFASCEQGAFDEAADSGKLDSCRVSDEEANAADAEEAAAWAYLGNASEPFDLSDVGITELPNPPRSFVALFRAAFPGQV